MEFVEHPLEPFGEMLLEVSVPSDLGYKTPVVLRIIKKLQEHGCLPPGDNPRAELVLDEALTNAILHGNNCDPDKEVTVRLCTDSQRWCMVVEDEGEGFSPEQLEQPETALLSRGRGVQLMDSYLDELRYNAAGNAVMLVRHCQPEVEREKPEPEAADKAPEGGVEVRQEGDVAVVCIHERRVSQENIREVNQAVTRAARDAAALVLDMRDVGFITSVFIRTLVSRHKEFNQRRGYFVLAGLRPEVVEILASVALDKVLEIAEGPQEAVASVRSRLQAGG